MWSPFQHTVKTHARTHTRAACLRTVHKWQQNTTLWSHIWSMYWVNGFMANTFKVSAGLKCYSVFLQHPLSTSCFYGTGSVIIEFTKPRYWSIVQVTPIQLIHSHPTSPVSILILTSNYACVSQMVCSLMVFRLKRISHLLNACYMPLPSHTPWHDQRNSTRSVQIMKLLIMQSSPSSCHFIPLKSKYSLQHLFSNTLHGLPLAWETKFHTHTKQKKPKS